MHTGVTSVVPKLPLKVDSPVHFRVSFLFFSDDYVCKFGAGAEPPAGTAEREAERGSRGSASPLGQEWINTDTLSACQRRLLLPHFVPSLPALP